MKPHLTLPVIFLFVTLSAILLLSRYIIKPIKQFFQIKTY